LYGQYTSGEEEEQAPKDLFLDLNVNPMLMLAKSMD
jgi:hypothetical protein